MSNSPTPCSDLQAISQTLEHTLFFYQLCNLDLMFSCHPPNSLFFDFQFFTTFVQRRRGLQTRGKGQCLTAETHFVCFCVFPIARRNVGGGDVVGRIISIVVSRQCFSAFKFFWLATCAAILFTTEFGRRLYVLTHITAEHFFLTTQNVTTGPTYTACTLAKRWWIIFIHLSSIY